MGQETSYNQEWGWVPITVHTASFPASQPLILEGWRCSGAPPQGTPTCLAHELLLVVQGTVFLAGLDGHINRFSFLQ